MSAASTLLWFCLVVRAAAAAYPRHILFELGLNRGQTLSDLLTATSEDRNRLKPLLSTLLGGQPFVPSQWCVQGFEANPVFAKQLRSLEESISNAGLCVRLNTRVMAGVSESVVPFYIDGKKDALHGPTQEYFAEGSTMDPVAGKKLRNYRVKNVTSIDFASYLSAALLGKEGRQGALAVLRMDIEGGEYTMLPHLLQPRPGSGGPPALCKLDLLVIEFHYKRVAASVVKQHADLRRALLQTCPRLRVVLDPGNYEEEPWKSTWPLPDEWKHIQHLTAYAKLRGGPSTVYR
mmetsp:Transcript_2959/g.9603  ORF Transcript_2959/g.9603 Transcript_2959/m.9603 type:complete len:291 (+) Transcript_2959:62-934(+)